MFQSLRTKILAAEVSLVVAAVTLSGLLTYLLIVDKLLVSERDRLARIAQYAGNSLDAVVSGKESIIARIAQGEPVARYGEKYQEQMLRQFLDRFSTEFPVLTYVNEQGLEELKVRNGRLDENLLDLGDGDLVTWARAHPNAATSAFSTRLNDPNRSYVEFAYCRHNFFDEFEGLIIGRVPVSRIVHTINQFRFHDGGYACVLGRDGTILAHPDPLKIGECVALTDVLRRGSNDPDVRVDAGQGRTHFLGRDQYVAYRTVPQRDWISLAVLPYEEYTAASRTLLKVMLLILTMTMAVTFVGSRLMATRVTRPLRVLEQAVHEVAHGDFKRIVPIASRDEVGRLGDAFNTMVEKLRASTTSIDNLNQEILQRQQAEQRQTETLRQLEASNSELQSFAYVASHDLKAPLRGIKTLADWVLADYGDRLEEEGRENLRLLGLRVHRMQDLIDGILQYSRVGRVQGESETVNLNECVAEIIETLAVPDHIGVSLQTPLPTVDYDPTRLTQVFQNLISNAIKYMDKPQGRVHVGFTEDDRAWTFCVTDNGPGIQEKFFEKVFVIFQTLNPRDKVESTGVGLAVVKKIVEMAGGEIWLTSEVGAGCSFFFTILKSPRPVVYTEEGPVEMVEA